MITTDQYFKRYPADAQIVGQDATLIDIFKSDVLFAHKVHVFAELYVEHSANRTTIVERDENGDVIDEYTGPLAPFIEELMEAVATKYPYATRPGVANVSQQPARDAYFNLEHYVKDWSYPAMYHNANAQKFHLGAALNIMDKIGLNRLDQMVEIVERIMKGEVV